MASQYAALMNFPDRGDPHDKSVRMVPPIRVRASITAPSTLQLDRLTTQV